VSPQQGHVGQMCQHLAVGPTCRRHVGDIASQVHDHGLGTYELYFNFGWDAPTPPDLPQLFGLPVHIQTPKLLEWHTPSGTHVLIRNIKSKCVGNKCNLRRSVTSLHRLAFTEGNSNCALVIPYQRSDSSYLT